MRRVAVTFTNRGPPQKNGAVSFRRMLGGRPRTRESGAHRVHDGADGRKHPQERERSPVNEHSVIDEHLELPIAAVHHVDFGAQLPPNACRHPDGMEARDSVDAVTDRDSGHCWAFSPGRLTNCA